jgi:hypothetical protein
LPDYYEIREFKSVTFVSASDLDLIDSLDIDGGQYILYLDRNIDNVDSIFESFEVSYGFNNKELLYEADYSDVYLLNNNAGELSNRSSS